MKKLLNLLLIALGLLISIITQAQNQKVTGKVTGSDGSALPGVTVSLKGSTTGIITNGTGNYDLTIPSGKATLIFSFIGMKTVEQAVNNQSVINIQLQEDVIGIEEVVAIGYGTMKKSDLTGAITSIKSETIIQKPTPSIESSLQGRIAGVQITTTSAAPGGSSSVIIRGGNSINSSINPLYVVDGYPMDASDITLINPIDVESIEVLKDGSSTAIYGSRGANGVILISTKRGKSGITQVDYSVYSRFDVPYNSYDMVNAKEFATLYDEAQKNKGLPTYFTGADATRPAINELGEGTNWFDELTRNGIAINNQLSVKGGNLNTKYRFSANYYTQKGVMINDDIHSGSLSSTVDSEINKWLKIGFSLNTYRHTKNIRSQVGFFRAMYPFIPVYDNNGNYNNNYFPDNLMLDESPMNYVQDRTNQNISDRTNGNLYIQVKPMKGMEIKSLIGGYINNSEINSYFPTTTVSGAKVGGAASIDEGSTNSFLNENILTYQTKFGEDHRINLMGAYSLQYEKVKTNSISGSGFTSDDYTYNNIGAASNPGIPSSYQSKWQLASFTGRTNYVLKNKYLLTITGRADGSSKFGADNRWAFFPSVAFAWRASEESFVKEIKDISYLKIRLSYGETGNSNIGLYQSLGNLGVANYIVGDARVSGIYPIRVANPDLKWETTIQYDAGFDLGLFKDRLSITGDFYYKETTDLLLDVNVNATSGYNSALKNIGSLRNTGAELSVNAKLIDNTFKWGTTWNISYNKNKITKLNEGGRIFMDGGGSKDVQIILEEGQPIGQFSGKAMDGIFHNESEINEHVNDKGELLQPTAKPGDIKLIDSNGDGIISADDWAILGNSNPDFIYSLNSSMTWKNFSFDIFFNGVYGNEIFNGTKLLMIDTANPRATMLKEVLDRWTPDNPNGTYPRMGSIDKLYPIENGSYLKLNNLKLGYTFPKNLVSTIQNINIYFSMQNVFIITKYSGFDPDINSESNTINFGTDTNGYPNPRTYTFGINVTF